MMSNTGPPTDDEGDDEDRYGWGHEGYHDYDDHDRPGGDDRSPPYADSRDLLMTISGVICVLALLGFFAVELYDPSIRVDDRTVHITLLLIAVLLGVDTIAGRFKI